MPSKTSSVLPPQPSLVRKPTTLSVSEMLTPSELAQLKQTASENSAYLQEVYPDLKILA